ncbi:MAG: 3-hydroxyacyl-CoA dehydrogenase family protein [Candidatus Heimdallarchaeota archaeon]|nr:MAG: 3-hydroxyacyl-CoA dehydrogenase family protein [Candidatus Heimdallarchaeota archaeon]
MKSEKMKKVSVIGAGHMGHGIAEVALLSDYFVSLCDINEDIVAKGKAMIDWSLKKFVEKSKITEKRYKKLLTNLETTIDLERAAENTILCIEAVPERLELKKDIFRKLDTFSPKHAILASNTSTMSITEIGDATQRPDKVVGLHFPPPAVLAQVIEIVRGDKTSESTIKFAIDFTERAGKVPIISKDSPGFICNRIMAPSMLLIQLMLDRKEYTPAKIDAAALNMGMIMGPYELLDYIGLDVVYDSSKYYAERLSVDYSPSQTISKLVEKNKLGRKTGEGIYKWLPGGKRPIIDLSDPADFDLMDLMRVQINEAVKVLEEGIATVQDIDIGMKLHYHNPWGPFELVENMNLGELSRFLDNLAETYGKEVFRPHKWIQDKTLPERIKV